MSLTPQFLDGLRARTLLSTLIGKTVKVQKAGREYKACCPFHNEKTPSFTINDEKGFYHCFGCGAHGDAIRWMTDHRGLPFMEAVKELAQSAGMEVPTPDPHAARRAEQAKGLHDAMEAAQRFFVKQLEGMEGAEARAYLQKRGISNETVKAFGFGYAPDARGRLKAALAEFGEAMLVETGLLVDPEGGRESYDRFRGRLMLPIRDIRGRVIAFGGRILGQGEPKYLNSPDTPLFDKGRTLYNIDRASPASRQTDRIVVVEGYMDVVALAQAGIKDVVAPMGTAVTEHQIERLWKMADVPIMCFDGDTAGQKAANRAATRALPLLKPGKSLSFATLPTGMDPDDIVRSSGAESFRNFLGLSIPLFERIWRSERDDGPVATPEARAGLKQRLAEKVATIENPLVREQYERDLVRERFYQEFGFNRLQKAQLTHFIATAIVDEQGLSNMAERINHAIHKAVTLGLSRWPAVLYSHREHAASLEFPTQTLHDWCHFIINLSIEKKHLDEMTILSQLEESELPLLPQRNLRDDLRYSFYSRAADTETAENDLRQAIEVLLTRQELDKQLAAYHGSLKHRWPDGSWMTEADWSRHQLLTEQKRQNDAAIRRYLDQQEQLLAA